MLAQIVQAERSRIFDQDAENASPNRQIADLLDEPLADAGRPELLEPATGLVDHAERCVASPGDRSRCLDEPLEDGVEREL